MTGITGTALPVVSLRVHTNGSALGDQTWNGFKPILSGFPCF